MRGYTLFYTIAFFFSCMAHTQTNPNNYDDLTQQMINLDITTHVDPPSKFMLVVRKFSIIPLFFYKGYRYIRTKLYAISQYLQKRRVQVRV